ncbi:PTS mannitol transporter subunit IIA [Exiguobacterium sp. SH31]|uniref:PTS sugar transporter subunit IIA n=1 Tax=unclassified Exiguobacterium TaxID=2644629 RepID=UPI0008C98DA2|nr:MULTISPECIES: PTS sugar transporter subunit IIA [unclassified Exiguobacterium]OGX78791.1 PTS mannitol transporter subunit IIA [Exiguobacterium sp. SH31]TCI51868.1 PTS mannitol transporter subunit IIA [Exiguobacterium sp. SH1S21]TCI69000.1 PTS mannitol transporter subunit IIA [Exiguobacterium sp. SH0S7]
MPFIQTEMIRLNQSFNTTADAINAAGSVLQAAGCVSPAYVEAMHERQALSNVYIGNQVAIPHGTESAKSAVQKTGISFLQVPEGVDFGGQTAKLVIGIAGVDDEHLELLSQIAVICSDEDNVERLVQAKTKEEILSLFMEEVAS